MLRGTKKALLIIISIFFCLGSGGRGTAQAEEYFYAIRIQGVHCGYAHVTRTVGEIEGREMILMNHKVFIMISAMGSQFNMDAEFNYHIDPETHQFIYHDSDIQQGAIHIGGKFYVEGDSIRLVEGDANEETITHLNSDVILENTTFFPHLKRDFADKGLKEKSYEVYEVRDGEIQTSTYTKTGTEKLELAGKTYNAIMLDELNAKTGLKIKWWIDAETGLVLKTELPGNRIVYLSDASVVKKIKVAKLDDIISTRTNIAIADYQSISYMKVKAEIEPSGLWVTQESLNVPGQTFTGTIDENLVEGIFEIEHKRYDGSGAPPFPPDFSGDPSLKEFVEPGDKMESDDPEIEAKAREITKGSKDSWEAACRISSWVAYNIDYAIPGGGTAKKTYEIKAGECGAHSLLVAAFCRSVGIPARVVWGCLYTPNYGGSFAQHGWNEIYMGQAGWIPVDATAMETDYVDSGHIRVGIYQSNVTALNPKSFEVLEHRLANDEPTESDAAAEEKYAEYLGEYTAIQSDRVVEVIVQNGFLTVNIPNTIILPFNDPDEEGTWACKISPRVFATFERDDSGAVTDLLIHEIVHMQRTADPDSIAGDVPEEYRNYLGIYHLAQLKMDFPIIYLDGSLAIDDPTEGRIVKLHFSEEKEKWFDEFNKNSFTFIADDKGKATAIILDSPSRFSR
jgi:transglutaminase-like putative cysteine protease